ncbi:hypothetical protein EDB89DRAFT_2232476 [Lactarius sanguifluus]|nr:hypothetical protein EDB89DRAFT_2232476 [Lactarius sanguifluus]
MKQHIFVQILSRQHNLHPYKTALYSFYLPVALVGSSTVPLGEYFQIQDDYLDYSGTPEQIGKMTRISWTTSVHGAEARVKEVFCKVGVDAVYAEHSTQSGANPEWRRGIPPDCVPLILGEDLQTHQVVLELDDELSL